MSIDLIQHVLRDVITLRVEFLFYQSGVYLEEIAILEVKTEFVDFEFLLFDVSDVLVECFD
jgi:hypothetical protein